MKYEYCCNCSEPTGKAGAGDDSLYTDNDGPFCEDCFPDKERPQRKPLTDDDMLMIYGQNHEGKKYSLGRMVEAAHGIKE